MKTNSKIVLLLAGVAVSATATVSAYADDGQRGMRRHGGEGPRFEEMFKRADADNNGTITFEEFAAAGTERFTGADADGDGNITVDEIVGQMEREQHQRRAERMIERFDANDDGQVSLAEIEDHQRKMFALADRDTSGSIEADELPKHRVDRDGRGGRDGYGHKRFGRN